MIKDIFFDFDGTLVDTSEGIVNAMHYAFDKYGLERVPDENIKAVIGPQLAEMFEILWQTKDEDKIADGVRVFREYYSKRGVFESKLYDGVLELLKKLCGNGFMLYVVSSKPAVFIEQIFSRYNIGGFFSGTTAVDCGVRTLSKTERMKNLLAERKILVNNAVMVGDRAEDVFAAKANGVRSIGVTYGFGSAETLLGAGAWKLADMPCRIARFVAEDNCEF